MSQSQQHIVVGEHTHQNKNILGVIIDQEHWPETVDRSDVGCSLYFNQVSGQCEVSLWLDCLCVWYCQKQSCKRKHFSKHIYKGVSFNTQWTLSQEKVYVTVALC